MARVEIVWARSATKHRISRERSGHVVRAATTIIRQSAPEASPAKDDRLIFLGPDQTGTLLEVAAIEMQPSGLLIIHAMPMREKYSEHLKGTHDDD